MLDTKAGIFRCEDRIQVRCSSAVGCRRGVVLTKLLIQDERSTFIVRVSGDSMEGAGIYDGDELIVDRGIEPHDGHVVIAIVDGEMAVKRLRVTATGVVLQAENAAYPDVAVAELSELMIWGVATRCLHRLN